MTRRDAVLLFCASAPVLGWKMQGCEHQRDTLAALLETLGGAVAQLAGVMGQTDLAGRIQHHTQAAVNLLRAWVPGQAAAAAITALNLLIDDLKQLLEAKFRPLVTLALGTIAAIIEKIQSAGGGGEPPHTNIHLTQAPATSDEFKHNWDAVRASTPGMEQAPVL